jgi:3-oxoadipate enol-lactonase
MMETLVFKRNDVVLSYRHTGAGHDETLMFVHGVGGSLRQFDAQHDYFSNRYGVLSVSLRGHGRSSLPTVNSIENHALEKHCDDLLALIDDLQIKNIHFIGNSAGGVIGFHMIKMRNECFVSMTTYGTTAVMSLHPWASGLVSWVDRMLIRISAPRYFRFVAKHACHCPEPRQAVVDMFMEAKEAIPCLRANLGQYDHLGAIRKMTIPYLLIQCEFDGEINRMLGTTLEAVRESPLGTVLMLKDAGHMANLDQPVQFNQLVDAHLTRLACRRRQPEAAGPSDTVRGLCPFPS